MGMVSDFSKSPLIGSSESAIGFGSPEHPGRCENEETSASIYCCDKTSVAATEPCENTDTIIWNINEK